ncbi:MAG TPA: serine/threonine-protein kinase [Nannocystaceae bacterium]|nr:serine/threonine-protein kinase [Nannocystaceae bacterium]
MSAETVTGTPADSASFVRAHAREQVRAQLFGGEQRPTWIGRYQVLDRLGQGGMGVVYRARDPVLEREVAVKVLHSERAVDSFARARLVDEARNLARVTAMNVVQLYDAGQSDDDRVFLVMALVRGRDLRRWLREGTRSIAEVVEVFRAAARGLTAIHEAGLVHRDFKPENVLYGDDGIVRVADFGLARLLDGEDAHASASVQAVIGTLALSQLSTPPTRSRAMVGTPAYMAPELFEGGGGDVRSDVFAFAVSLFEALYGSRPTSDAPIDPRKIRGPRELEQVVRRGLAVDPEQRWPSIAAFMTAVVGATTPSRRRRRAALALASIGIVTAIAFVPRDPAPDGCTARAALLEQAWTPARRDEVQAQLAEVAGDSTRAVLDGLDARALAYHEAIAATCALRDDDGFDARIRCLDRDGQTIASLIDALTRGDPAAAARARDAVDGLPRPEQCMHAVLGGGADPSVAEEQAIAAAEASFHVGQYDDAIARAERLLASDESRARSVQARALLVRGRARIEQNDARRGIDDLTAAYHLADAEGELDTAIAAADMLAFQVGHGLGDPVEGRRWLRAAESLFARGARGISRVDLWVDDAALDVIEGRPHDAFAKLATAEVVAEVEAPDSRAIVDAYTDAGEVLADLDMAEQGIAHGERGLRLAIERYGARHPFTLQVRERFAGLHIDAGRIEEARTQLAQVIPDIRAMKVVDRLLLANALLDLGEIAMNDGNDAAALAALEEADAIQRSESTVSPLFRSVVLQSYGHQLMKLRDPKTIVVLEEMRALLEAEYGPDHEGVVHALNELGLAQAQIAGDRELGARTLERAIASAERTGGWTSAPTLVLGLHLNLGLVLLGVDPARARDELARTLARLPDDPAVADIRVRTLWFLADAHDRLGDHEAADARSAEALAFAQSVESPNAAAIASWRAERRMK